MAIIASCAMRPTDSTIGLFREALDDLKARRKQIGEMCPFPLRVKIADYGCTLEEERDLDSLIQLLAGIHFRVGHPILTD
jgi:hypothetical protein